MTWSVKYFEDSLKKEWNADIKDYIIVMVRRAAIFYYGGSVKFTLLLSNM